jgi:hypothetical protein
MPKRAVSLTLDEANLLWLRARGYGRGNLSKAIDDLISEARAGRLGGPPPATSVVGTIDIAADDPHLERADDVVRDLFARSLQRPTQVRERPSSVRKPTAPRGSRRRE